MNRKSGLFHAGLRRRIRADTPRRSTRREFVLAAVAWATLTSAGAARAQPPPVLIGWLHAGSREANLPSLALFNEGMSALGWKPGAQYIVEESWLNGRMELLHTAARNLASRKPRVIVVGSSTPAAAATKAAPETPIVMITGSPLDTGLVKNLARPGGMITGLAYSDSDRVLKLVEFLLEISPNARRVGFLLDPKAMSDAANRDAVQQSVKQRGIEARLAEASTPEELEPALARLVKEGVQGIIVMPNVWYSGYRERIIKVALAHRVPLFAGLGQYAEEGALIIYGADRVAQFRRVAYFVDRILKGAKPGGLPFEQPTKFELIVNMRTTKALGIAIPQSILVQADRVIE